MTMNDALIFLHSWLRNPRRTGALAPSGPALAKLITAGISGADGPVIELGPGTGVFTRALIARGVQEHQLTLIEANPAFAKILRQRFPNARLLTMDAAQLGQYTGDLFSRHEPAGAVVSGLPLLAIPLKKAASILHGAFQHLRADGAFYQFTYGRRFPLPALLLRQLGLEAQRTGTVFANVPPAAVYCVRRVNQ